MSKFFTALLFFLMSCLHVTAADLSTFTNNADAFFEKYVKDGRVSYQNVKNNSSQITSLYNNIGSMDLSGSSDEEKKAFYINAYNLIVIYQVTKFYPLKSPLDKSGFFDKVTHKVADESLTLNHLEIKKLVLPYNDPRIHFVLACAAESCPPLASFAYQADKLDQQLEQRTTLAINNNEWLRVDHSENTAYISKIFDWYKKDFTKMGISIVGFINKYRKSDIPGNYQVKYYEYNWSLNEG